MMSDEKYLTKKIVIVVSKDRFLYLYTIATSTLLLFHTYYTIRITTDLLVRSSYFLVLLNIHDTTLVLTIVCTLVVIFSMLLDEIMSINNKIWWKRAAMKGITILC